MNHQPEHIDKIDLITKVLADEATAEERRELETWKAADPTNQALFDEYHKTWDNIDTYATLTNVNVNDEWEKMQTLMSAEPEKQEPKVVSINRGGKRFATGRALRVAAMLCLVFISGALIFYLSQQGTNTLVAETGILESTLSDGSKIALNMSSSLSFPKKFGKKERTVTLQGEAFFQVARDETKPFIIDAGAATIEVLGTSFYVNTKLETGSVKVIVRSGKVAVTSNHDPTDRVILEAGDKAEIAKTKHKLVQSENEEVNYLAWQTRQLVFKNERLSQIVKVLNNVYHANIKVKDKAIKKCPVTVTFDRQSLEEILNVLEATLSIEVNKKETSIILSGDGC